MLFAILAYHEEQAITELTADQDASLMEDLIRTHDRINKTNSLGPAARLDFVGNAFTLRGPGEGVVVDGPFAETKEQLLGFYVLECETKEAAVEAARELRRVNKSAVYEIRPITVYLPGEAIGPV
jgi:hypothetical protein